MPRIEVTTPDGDIKVFYREGDLTFPEEMILRAFPTKDLAKQIQLIKELEIRSDDVVLCAFPKAGTHWVWEVLKMLSFGKAEYEVKVKETAMLEFSTKESLDSEASPRILNTHFTPNNFPAGCLEKKTKIIHVVRNPKDLAVSMFFHSQKMGVKIQTLSEFLKIFTSPLCAPCNYFDFLRSIKKFQEENPDHPVHTVFFEDMKKDPETEIKRMAKFLEKEAGECLVKEIAKKCDFSSMKAANEEVKDDISKKFSTEKKSFIYRKGAVGDWKNHLTVADNEMMDNYIQRSFADLDVTFQFE